MPKKPKFPKVLAAMQTVAAPTKRRPDERPPFVCEAFGCENTVPRRRHVVHGQQFCSTACRKRQWRFRQRFLVQMGRCCSYCGDLLGRRALKRRDVRYCSLSCKRAAQKLRKGTPAYVVGQSKRLLAERRRQREIDGRRATNYETVFEAEVEAMIAKVSAQIAATRAAVIAELEAAGHRVTPDEIDNLVLAVDLGVIRLKPTEPADDAR
jgi:hypothetical protein